MSRVKASGLALGWAPLHHGVAGAPAQHAHSPCLVLSLPAALPRETLHAKVLQLSIGDFHSASGARDPAQRYLGSFPSLSAGGWN